MERKLSTAQDLFDRVKQIQLIRGILDIRQGNYSSAVELLTENSYNSVLKHFKW